MKDLFWKISTLILTIALLVVVTSMATAVPEEEEEADAYGYADNATRKGVVIEQNKQRFQMFRGGMPGTDNEKLILYDTWDVQNTKLAWMMKDPHTEKPKWVPIPFGK